MMQQLDDHATEPLQGPSKPAVSLIEREEGLTLVCGELELRGDFIRLLPRLRKDRLGRELLVKAAKVKGVDCPTCVDATAGLGEDALLLAAAGFEVTLCESDPAIYRLLADALDRASRVPELESIVGRMHAVEADSTQVLAALEVAPDVVYLDPMFPERSKSAAVKKKFQLLHHLEPPCEDPERLLDAALSAGPRKIVIKRPIKGELLAGVKPSHSVAGKAVRYDCIVPPRS